MSLSVCNRNLKITFQLYLLHRFNLLKLSQTITILSKFHFENQIDNFTVHDAKLSFHLVAKFLRRKEVLRNSARSSAGTQPLTVRAGEQVA